MDLLCKHLTNLITLSISSKYLTAISDALSTSLLNLTSFSIKNIPYLTSMEPIFKCTQLTHLSLRSVIRSGIGISSGISKLVNLKRFATFNNGLTSIQPCILSLTLLEELFMEEESISIIPEELCTRLKNLNLLSLNSNPIINLPYELKYLVKLKNLYVSENKIMFPIPYSLNKLKITGLKQYMPLHDKYNNKSVEDWNNLRNKFPTLKEICARFVYNNNKN